MRRSRKKRVEEMDSSNPKRNGQKLEQVQLAIERLMEQRKMKEASGERFLQDDDDQLLLSKLLSQLESLKVDASLEKSLAIAASTADAKVGTKSKNIGDDDESEEIIKELKKVRKQNTITHWLLSIMIVLTVTWQLSEVSLILKLKDRVSHPFRSFGGMVAGLLQIKGPHPNTSKVNDDDKPFIKQLQIETPSLPHLTMPELPHMELPDLSLNGR